MRVVRIVRWLGLGLGLELELSGARPTALRAIIPDPLYKAHNSLAEKKNAWQKV